MAKKITKTKTTTKKSKGKGKTEVTQEKSENIELTHEEKKSLFTGFYDFLSQYAVVGLAIGIVIGNTTQSVVKNIVDGLITPMISVVMNFLLPALGPITTWNIDINGTVFKPGTIVQSLIEFTIVLFLIYFIVKVLLRREDLLEKKK